MHVNMHCRVIDQQLGIDRGSTRVAVEICQMGTDAPQVDESGNGSQQVVLREMILKRELVEQRRLRLLPRPIIVNPPASWQN